MVVRKERGYTLVELLLVIGLMGLLSTLMILNGSEARNQAQLQTAAQALESALTQAQSYGNSGRAFSNATDKFDRGYGVYLTEGSNKIIIYGGQGDGGDGTYSASEEKYTAANVSETITLSGGVTIDDISWTSGPPSAIHELHVLFRRGQSEAHIHGNNAGQVNMPGAKITLKTGSSIIDVYVYKTGLIHIDQ